MSTETETRHPLAGKPKLLAPIEIGAIVLDHLGLPATHSWYDHVIAGPDCVQIFPEGWKVYVLREDFCLRVDLIQHDVEEKIIWVRFYPDGEVTLRNVQGQIFSADFPLGFVQEQDAALNTLPPAFGRMVTALCVKIGDAMQQRRNALANSAA